MTAKSATWAVPAIIFFATLVLVLWGDVGLGAAAIVSLVAAVAGYVLTSGQRAE
ncbi:MAG TPA: hypothetical protein VHF89_06690 [Solirubrobacteraceae bacterium]|nr:hypothetical protein [Solirubrobacteraceae bacterium]